MWRPAPTSRSESSLSRRDRDRHQRDNGRWAPRVRQLRAREDRRSRRDTWQPEPVAALMPAANSFDDPARAGRLRARGTLAALGWCRSGCSGAPGTCWRTRASVDVTALRAGYHVCLTLMAYDVRPTPPASTSSSTDQTDREAALPMTPVPAVTLTPGRVLPGEVLPGEPGSLPPTARS